MSYMIGRYIETLSDWGMGAHTCHALRDVFDNSPSAVSEAAYVWCGQVYEGSMKTTEQALAAIERCPRIVQEALTARTGTDDWTR